MRQSILVFGVIFSASVASAQGYGGGGGFGGGGMGGMGRHGGGGRSTGNGGSSVDQHTAMLARAYDADNPVALMLASRTDLKLADSQVVSLQFLEARIRDRNQPLRAQLDSLRPQGDSSQPIDWANITPRERDSIITTRKAVAQTMGAIHDNVVQTRTDALATMTPAQQKQYADIESKVEDAIRSGALNQSQGGQRGGWGGRGGGGGGGGWGGGSNPGA
jgi:hypothetical protein